MLGIQLHRFGAVLATSAHYQRRLLHSKSPEDILTTWGKSVLEKMGVEVKVTGPEPTGTPRILVGNHVGYLDIPLLVSQVPCAFLVKKEISSWPVFGKACKDFKMVFVERNSLRSRKEAIEGIVRCIEIENKSVAVFPSGTTTLDESSPWKPTVFRIAKERQIPVQPFRISFSPLEKAAFIGDDLFVPHLWKLLSLPKIHAHIEFQEPFFITEPKIDCEKTQEWSRQAKIFL